MSFCWGRLLFFLLGTRTRKELSAGVTFWVLLRVGHDEWKKDNEGRCQDGTNAVGELGEWDIALQYGLIVLPTPSVHRTEHTNAANLKRYVF